MKINIELNTAHGDDLIALKAMIDSLAGVSTCTGTLPDNIDRGSGPLKEFEANKVTITTSKHNGEEAIARVNLDESVTEVALEDLNGDEIESPPKAKTTVSKKDAAKAVGKGESKPKPKKETKKPDAKKVVEAVVNVKTTDVEVEGTIDEALDQLDPPKPEPKKTDNAAELRKLMVDVVKAHGPKGAKLASQTVNKIAGVKDVTKIPAEKFEAVADALRAVIEVEETPPAEAEPPSTKAVDKKPDEEPEASPDDVDF